MSRRGLYLIGGAGTGKSTFMNELVARAGLEFAPMENLLSRRNARQLVPLNGHTVQLGSKVGTYVGVMRDYYPGADGLNRACSTVGEEWLDLGHGGEFIVAGGATMATRRFIGAMHRHTDLLVLALHCSPAVHAAHLEQRGDSQKETFVRSTVTKTTNLARDLRTKEIDVGWVDTGISGEWEGGLEMALDHLHGRSTALI